MVFFYINVNKENIIYDPILFVVMTKLQKVKAYHYKDHDIYKYRINIPLEFIKKLNWDSGVLLEFKVKNKKLEVSKSK
jgi:hypothetical protein